ncbi:MAG TPA: tetratricopeptide repeat protein [Abditibacteriaceae bacterium]|jgi:tetratricopeptide (TPR) repeat protein
MSANDTGYILADAARNKRELSLGAVLTGQALDSCEEALRDMSRPELKKQMPHFQFGCANVRDSVAWALYRQQRYKEALLQQEQAIAETSAVAALMGTARQSEVNRTKAELRYHLGEIYRALDRREEARQQFQMALKVVPRHSGVVAGLRALEREPLSGRQRR